MKVLKNKPTKKSLLVLIKEFSYFKKLKVMSNTFQLKWIFSFDTVRN